MNQKSLQLPEQVYMHIYIFWGLDGGINVREPILRWHDRKPSRKLGCCGSRKRNSYAEYRWVWFADNTYRLRNTNSEGFLFQVSDAFPRVSHAKIATTSVRSDQKQLGAKVSVQKVVDSSFIPVSGIWPHAPAIFSFRVHSAHKITLNVHSTDSPHHRFSCMYTFLLFSIFSDFVSLKRTWQQIHFRNSGHSFYSGKSYRSNPHLFERNFSTPT